tara:strand:- start:130 stop:1191 length:1062 start_codon:yes stop_codon:yes gene_type:complete
MLKNINKIYLQKSKKFIFIILLLNLIATISIAENVTNSAVVYMYHRFGEPDNPSTNISLEQFKKQLEELSKPKYNVVKLEYIIDSIITQTQLPTNTIAISIDDGHNSIIKKAWPLLKEYNFPVTLFISTDSIDSKYKNYLTWDQIRTLKKEGADIGAHTKTHPHLHTMSVSEIKEEIEYSNKRYLSELGEMPKLFAYPFGEANSQVIKIIQDYKFKAAFGQHSGVINETSDLNYLPRFSINEKYGSIDRIKFSGNAKGLGIYDLTPIDPEFSENPPFIGFSLLDKSLSKSLNCFIFDGSGNIESEIYNFEERIEIRLQRKIKEGRVRMNCTAKDNQNNWRWFGHQFIMPNYLD